MPLRNVRVVAQNEQITCGSLVRSRRCCRSRKATGSTGGLSFSTYVHPFSSIARCHSSTRASISAPERVTLPHAGGRAPVNGDRRSLPSMVAAKRIEDPFSGGPLSSPFVTPFTSCGQVCRSRLLAICWATAVRRAPASISAWPPMICERWRYRSRQARPFLRPQENAR